MRALLFVVALFMAAPAFGQTCSKGFVINGADFIGPDGKKWSARGLNVDIWDAQQNLPGILKNYPGLTMIRLVTLGSKDTLATIDPVVKAITSQRIVVEIEDHEDSQSGRNIAYYSMLAAAYKDNPYVFLETPNEPGDPNTAQNQIAIIKAIRAAGFNNPIGLQPLYGYDMSNIPTVVSAVGVTNIYATPHIYGSPWQQAVISGAANSGLFAVIDEFGNAMDGFTMDPQGQAVIDGVVAANQTGAAGAVFWAAGNGYHPDGADSACTAPDCSGLTSTGQNLKPWLSGATRPQTDGCQTASQTTLAVQPTATPTPSGAAGIQPTTIATAPSPTPPAQMSVPADLAAQMTSIATSAPPLPTPSMPAGAPQKPPQGVVPSAAQGLPSSATPAQVASSLGINLPSGVSLTPDEQTLLQEIRTDLGKLNADLQSSTDTGATADPKPHHHHRWHRHHENNHDADDD